MIRHFYHLYADGDWRPALLEHLLAMETITDPVDAVVGVVGSKTNRKEAIRCLPDSWWYEEHEDGYEQRTLELIRQADIKPDDLVLYAHTKGAGNPSLLNTGWRRCMTKNLIRGWRTAVGHIFDGADTVGVHWLTPEQYPKQVQIPYYGGNFWWATGDHILQLPPPSYESRYHAEAWLGTVSPDNPVDLQPGWPGEGCAYH